ncbi:Intermediate filament protein [Tulasnella sp. 418]|nr:Intermediate filament protein [Tulasnella sp. 418]
MWAKVFLITVVAILLPVGIQVASSPAVLLVLSPLLVTFVLLLFLTSNVIVAYLLTLFRPYSRISKPHHFNTPLIFSTAAAWQAVLTRNQWSAHPSTATPLYPSSPQIDSVLNQIINFIIRDFVLVWYNNISSSPTFPSTLDSTLHHIVNEIIRRIEIIDLPSLVVHRILPKVTEHIEKFRQSEIALRGVGLERHLTQSEELDILLASRYAGKDGRLHPAVDNLSSPVTKQTEQAHLRRLVERILPLLLPTKEADSKGVGIVAREIVACVVLSPVMEMLADPDFWNKTIDEAAGAAIRQRKLISKVRNILEVQSTGGSVPSQAPSSVTSAPLTRGPRMENITSKTAARQFDSFIRSIQRCDSLLDARRLKNDVGGEIRRTRLLLANHEKEEWINGEKASDIVTYLDRLYNAKREVEKRIGVLGGRPEESTSQQSVFHERSASQKLTLRDVLSNPGSLSYFMEFMDRRNRSIFIQFWLTVETFKDPLEEADSGDDNSSDDEDLLEAPALPSASATIQGDMSMIYELYFSNPSSLRGLSCISPKHIEMVRSFVLNSTTGSSSQGPARASALKEKRVRNSVLLAQRQVETEMEEDFQEFERSDLWFRAVEDVDSGKGKSSALSIQPPAAPIAESEAASPIAIPRGPQAQRSKSARPMFLVPSRSLTRSDSAPGPPTTASTTSLSSKNPTSADSQQLKPASSLAFLIAPDNSMLSDGLQSSSNSQNVPTPRAPLFDEPSDQEAEEGLLQQETIEALQAALTDIIATENNDLKSQRLGDSTDLSQSSSRDKGWRRRMNSVDSAEPFRYSDENLGREFLAPSVEEEDDPEDRHSDNEDANSPSQLDQIAAPGDLQLSYEIDRLTEKINKLQAQETILDTLIRKAELTGDAQELKILRRSKSSMNRELRELSFTRTQFEKQEAENRLYPDRTKIFISSTAVGNIGDGEEGGKQVVRYLVEVQQLGVDGSFASGWLIARRYNEFYAMHQQLKEKFILVRSLEFPPKKLVTSLAMSFIDTRRAGLEKYMQALIKIPLVCESQELRSFLSRQQHQPIPPGSSNHRAPSSSSLLNQGLMQTMYRSVAGSIDDMFFGPSMLDVMIQRLSKQAADFAGIAGSGMQDEDLITQALKAKVNSDMKENNAGSTDEAILNFSLSSAPGDLKPLEGESGLSSFSAPICDLILAVFELDKKNNWLRKQAIVIILQQVLGGTIERKLREVAKTYGDEDHLLQYLKVFQDGLWPGGSLKPPSTPRSPEERIRTREEVNRKLSSLMPDLAANMIGRSNARRGARRMFAVLQNRRLNQHLMYSIVDEVVLALFPELPRET